MPRLFTALEIAADVAAELALLRGGLLGARWVEPEDYHLTLRFIGDVERSLANDVAEALLEARCEPFALTLGELRAFGGGKPRALVAAVKDNAALEALHASHETLMRRLGMPAETRKYAPHVSLAHLRRTPVMAVADYLGRHGPLRQRMRVERFALFSARPEVGGGPYLREALYPLRGGPFRREP